MTSTFLSYKAWYLNFWNTILIDKVCVRITKLPKKKKNNNLVMSNVNLILLYNVNIRHGKKKFEVKAHSCFVFNFSSQDAGIKKKENTQLSLEHKIFPFNFSRQEMGNVHFS